jgi:hypothetical protein
MFFYWTSIICLAIFSHLIGRKTEVKLLKKKYTEKTAVFCSQLIFFGALLTFETVYRTYLAPLEWKEHVTINLLLLPLLAFIGTKFHFWAKKHKQ